MAKEMKKQLAIIGIAVLLFTVGLSGCTESGNKFNGTWVGNVVADPSMPFYLTEVTFSDANAYYTIEWGTTGKSTYSGTYDTEGSTLVLINEVGGAYTFTYRFEEEIVPIIGTEETSTRIVLYLDNSRFTKQ